MRKNKLFLMLIFLLMLSGCSVEYDLDISSSGVQESFDVVGTNSNENITEYAIPAYYGVMGFHDLGADFLEKKDSIQYYDSVKNKKDGVNLVHYNYFYRDDSFLQSNILKSSYKTVIIKNYDHDEDGKTDYMMITTDDKFNYFNMFPKIDKIVVRINCHYEIVSSNADKVEGSVLTWYLTHNDNKSINMVYNPSVITDYRTLWERIMDGDYVNMFTISLVLLVIVGIILLILKKIGEARDRV